MESMESDAEDSQLKEEEACDDIKSETMTHQEAMAFFRSKIASLMETDPLLKGIPAREAVTLEELNSHLAHEHGRAMFLNICREDQETYYVIVEKKATVLDLKKAIQRHVTLKMKREDNERCISWRYVWRTYWLYYERQKLTQDNKPLSDYGIHDGAFLYFKKRLRNK